LTHQLSPAIQAPGKSAPALASPRPVLFAPLALVLASGCRRADLAKLALLGTLVTGFFLFTGKTWLPGGGSHFMTWAEAIVHGTTLPPDIAQRDAGFPLLIVLSGYPVHGSIIPIFLIHAAFAIALPLLIYEALRRFSPPIAFYSALLGVVTLAPIHFMKMIHHDQTYIFFTLLTACPLLVFVQTQKYSLLYFFTAAAIAASIARPAGNALFPLLLVVAYLAARGDIRHYLLCAAIFIAAIAAYGWHRYVIFDMRHAASIPSYTGEQLFQNPYLNTYDYGIRLVPEEVGPNLVTAVERLRERLQPSPKDSEFVKRFVGGYAPGYQREFAEANILPFTADELIDRMFLIPNYEYWMLFCAAAEDRLMLRAAGEIVRAHPGLVLRYAMRNLFHFIFDPGYAHTRYNLNRFRLMGLPFFPAVGNVEAGEAAAIAPRAAREAQFDPLVQQRQIVRDLFHATQRLWERHYRRLVRLLAGLMCAAWATAIVALAYLLLGRGNASARRIGLPDGRLLACIVIASLVFGYNAAVTSVFVDPDFRYRQMVDLPAVVLAGFGVVSIRQWCFVIFAADIAPAENQRAAPAESLRIPDLFQRCTGTQLTVLVMVVALAVFACWAIFMLQNTTAA
jgi:hypothetical protein